MGELAKTLVSLSGPDAVHGVIPSALLPLEAKRRDEISGQPIIEVAKSNGEKDKDVNTPDENVFGRTTIVPDMHTRKRMMCDLVCAGGPGSGFVALSGGYGTLEELMEIVTWNQLGIQDRGVCAFNVEGYWDGILQWVKQSVDAGFVGEGNRDILVEGKSAEECVERLRRYEVSEGRFKLKWEDENSHGDGKS